MRNLHKYLFALMWLLAAGICAHAQVITTVAGSGDFCPGLPGDDGPATAACVHIPAAVLADGSGNFFIGNGHVRKVNTAGIIDTFAGGGTGPDGGPAVGAGGINACGLAADGTGNHYVAVIAMHRIRKINTAGIISTVAGTGTNGYTGDGGPATAANLSGPAYINFDAAGNMYITHSYHIRKVNAAGIITTIAGTNVGGYSGDGGPATAAQFNGAGSIVVDSAANIFFADGNNVIRKITPEGIISTYAGTGAIGFSGDGGPASAARFGGVIAMAIDPWNNLYVADGHNNRIRMINPAGIITTIAGNGIATFAGDGGPAIAASLNKPGIISVDPAGNIYISDQQNHRIRKISTFNRAPSFTLGGLATLSACGEFNPIDTLLQAMDTNSNQPITWSVVSPPANGVAVVSYTTTSTGAVLTPAGTGYTPAGGYSGPDTFRVRVFDGAAADTITIAVDVQLYPVAAPVTGADTICVGAIATLSGPGSGAWASPHTTVVVGAGTGIITGISIGTAIVSYTVTNYCGTATATHLVTILPAGTCPTGIGTTTANNTISIFPNPNDGAFTLQLPQGLQAHITITDITGRTVTEPTVAATCPCHLLLPPACGAGVYFVEVVAESYTWRGKVTVW